MDLIYIDEFVTLVEVGNYQRAADKLFITQSTLSKHIKSLEKELGYDLFIRKYHQLELTEEGKQFLPHANTLANEYRQLLMDSSNRAANKDHKIIVACSSSRTMNFLSNLTVRFHKEFPDCALNVKQIESCEAEDVLKRKAANIALVISDDKPIQIDGFESVLLSQCAQIKVFLPTSHKLASSPYLRLEQLTNEEFISLPKVAYSASLLRHILEEKGLKFNTSYSVRNRDTAISFVKNGLAIFVGREDLNDEKTGVTGVVSIPLRPEIKLYLHLLYPSGELPVEEQWVITRMKLL